MENEDDASSVALFFQKFELFTPRWIGSGQFARVYITTHGRNDDQYAVKLISKGHVHKMFQKSRSELHSGSEVFFHRQMQHPYIIPCLRVLEDLNFYANIQPYCLLGDVKAYVLQFGAASIPMAENFNFQLLQAMLYIHSKDVSHRDVKLENILLDQLNNDVLKIQLIDFGFAKHSALYFGCSTCVGTPDYMAPEILMQIHVPQRYGRQVDVWAMGISLYIVFLGMDPFVEGPLKDQICNCAFDFSCDEWMALPDHMKNQIRAMLMFSPRQRLHLSGLNLTALPFLTFAVDQR